MQIIALLDSQITGVESFHPYNRGSFMSADIAIATYVVVLKTFSEASLLSFTLSLCRGQWKTADSTKTH
jgi:hypothetical protein